MKKFACAFTCIAGEITEAVIDFMRKEYGVDYIDLITEPGINRVLANSHSIPPILLRRFKKSMEISVNKKESKIVAIAGHEGCLDNPHGKQVQTQHLEECRRTIESFGCKGIEKIVLLWIRDDCKTVEVV